MIARIKEARGQRGQVVPLFALMATVIIGMIAVGVDFGVVAFEHRDLQEYADNAALGGAELLTLAAQQAGGATLAAAQQSARQQAFVILRDNMFGAGGSSTVPLSSLNATCFGSGASQFAADIKGCTLPAPHDNVTVSICAPGETTQSGSPCAVPESTNPGQFLSVRLVESVPSTFAGLLGINSSSATGFAEAKNVAPLNQSQSEQYALFSQGCVGTGNDAEVVGGDAYIASCGINPQSHGHAAFCSLNAGLMAGNIDFGPNAVVPDPLPIVGDSVAACEAAAAGNLVATGSFHQLATALPVPKFPPPPGYTNFDPTQSYPVAAATNACVNGTVNSSGVAPNNCFNPGYYSTITGIANNLNPGVYYVTGTPACTASSATDCTGATFTGNTLNANWSDVKDSCWAAPNSPSTAIFVSPCDDGFVSNPTNPAIADPQCSGSSASALLAPVPVVAPVPGGGLGGPAPGKTYFIRVSSLGAFGESAASAAVRVVVNSTAGQGSIAVTFAAVPGATGYRVYMSPHAEGTLTVSPRDEVLVGTASPAPAVTNIDELPDISAAPYPVFDGTSCGTGFRNIPARASHSQNNGVTFVLANKADLAVGGGAQVYLSPYCSTERSGMPVNTSTGDTQVPLPAGVSYGTDCPYTSSGSYINDGAFPIYGTSTGIVGMQNVHPNPWSFLEVSGTVFTPSATLVDDTNADFSVAPGQVIVGQVQVQSGFHPNPLVYFPCCGASGIGARANPTLTLVR